MAVSACVEVRYGTGIHAWDFLAIYGVDVTTSLKLMLVNTVLFGLANTFTKLSILSFYKGICTTSIVAPITTVTIWIVSLWGFVVFWLGIFQCTPFDGFYSIISPPDMKCISIPFFKIYAATDIVLDFFILALPLKSLWSLHVSVRKRLYLVLLFSFGGLCVLLSFLYNLL